MECTASGVSQLVIVVVLMEGDVMDATELVAEPWPAVGSVYIVALARRGKQPHFPWRWWENPYVAWGAYHRQKLIARAETVRETKALVEGAFSNIVGWRHDKQFGRYDALVAG